MTRLTNLAAIGLSGVWGWPILLAALILFGLFAALLGQSGVWLWVSWAALLFPLAVIVLAVIRARGQSPSTRARAATLSRSE